MMVDNPAVFWSVIISMYIGNIILLILNLPLIPYIAKLLTVPRHILLPMILFLSLIGVYLISFNTFEMGFMVVIAVVAFVLRMLDFPMAPLVLGFVLGGMMEENLRRAITIHDNSFAFVWQRPITLVLLSVTLVLLLLPAIRPLVAAARRGRSRASV